MTASRSRRGGSWRNLCAGAALVRSAGYGFAAAVLIQGATMAERALGTSLADEVAVLEASEFLLAEPAAGPEPADAPVDQAGDVLPFDVSGQHPECDLRLLRAIDERSRQLDAWSSDLAARARMLEVIEARASEQVQALQAERKALETTLAGVDREAEAGIAHLVEIYENMKPKEAARIFEAMPAEVAAGFVRRMAEKESALVMGNLNAEHAYAITLALANSRAPLADP
jgi:flagellar motility protein MotE (MotC chaperone)